MVPVGVVVQSADGTVCSWNLRLMMQLLQAMELAATADHASLRTAAQLLQALSTLPMRERAMALSSIEWSLRDVSRPVWNFTDASNRVLGPLSLPDLARWCAAGRFAPCDTQALLCHRRAPQSLLCASALALHTALRLPHAACPRRFHAVLPTRSADFPVCAA